MPERLSDILYSQQFTTDWIDHKFLPSITHMNDILEGSIPVGELVGRRVAIAFWEDSPRTDLSFRQAIHFLGGSSETSNIARMISADVPGENLEDSARTVEDLEFDCLVLRYHQEGGAERAAAVVDIPIINAGERDGQHPTQALLDIETIHQKFGRLGGLKIAMVGNLANNRVAESLGYLLGKYSNNTFYLVSPQMLPIKPGIKQYWDERNHQYQELRDLREVLPEVDVVYLTQITQKFEHAVKYESGPTCYGLNSENIAQLSETAIIMHPLPRGTELPSELNDHPGMRIRQMTRNGVLARMALLKEVLS